MLESISQLHHQLLYQYLMLRHKLVDTLCRFSVQTLLILYCDREQISTHSCEQGHTNPINSVCWDPSGDFLATVSEDMVKVWTLGTGSEGECVHELSCNGNKFQSCVFHPTYPSLLVIGCYQVSLMSS